MGNVGRVLLYRIAVVASAWMVSGCGPKSGKLPTYMQPELLYLNDQPYSRLYVEVDSVEGVEVPEQLLDDLRAFLSKHCSKPDGIEIVRDKPIPLSEIKDVPMGPASVLYLDGPDPNSSSQLAKTLRTSTLGIAWCEVSGMRSSSPGKTMRRPDRSSREPPSWIPLSRG